ncbi:MAG: hypothetical protein AB9903_05955 [Vulcanimicrobiota bacterium]
MSGIISAVRPGLAGNVFSCATPKPMNASDSTKDTVSIQKKESIFYDGRPLCKADVIKGTLCGAGGGTLGAMLSSQGLLPAVLTVGFSVGVVGGGLGMFIGDKIGKALNLSEEGRAKAAVTGMFAGAFASMIAGGAIATIGGTAAMLAGGLACGTVAALAGLSADHGSM